MDTQLILILQIFADIMLFMIVMFLLYYIRKSLLDAKKLLTGGDNISELKKLIAESNDSLTVFSRIIDESSVKFKDLACDLLDIEKRLRESGYRYAGKLDVPYQPINALPDHYSQGDEYQGIMTQLNEGSSMAQIAARCGMTEGEISLIVGLERKKMEISMR